MKKDARLKALDGLRGLSILFVFLSHANLPFLPHNPITKVLTQGGFVGVAFLFILSGFLMAYLYPNPRSKLDFLQKRYSRIFPLFISICLATFITWVFLINEWYLQILTLVLTAAAVNIFWTRIVKPYFSEGVKRLIFISFLLLQVAMAIVYIWISSRPSTFFFNDMPNFQRLLVTFLVNITLTFPISTYAFVMSAVLWSLAAEVLFYITYPFIFVPIIGELNSRSKLQKVIFTLSLFPLFGGLFLISLKIGHFGILSVYFFVYFLTGMSMGYIYRNNRRIIIELSYKIKGLKILSPFIFFFLILFLLNFTTNPQNSNFIHWIWIIFAVPLSFLFLISLTPDTYLSKIFSTRFLVFIGTISYSLYLTHMFILGLVHNIMKSTTVNSQIIEFLLSLMFSIVLAVVLYILLEKPYFIKSKVKREPFNLPYSAMKHMALSFSCFILFFFVLVFVVFLKNFSLFSIEKISFPSVIISKNSLSFPLKATEKNLGAVDMSLIKSGIGSPEKKKIVFKIKEDGAKTWYSISNYYINNPGDSFPNVFGFPPIEKSLNKNYIFTIDLIGFDENSIVKNIPVQAIYLVDKKELIKNPKIFFSFVFSKIETIIRDREFQLELILIIPFATACLLLIFSKRQGKV